MAEREVRVSVATAAASNALDPEPPTASPFAVGTTVRLKGGGPTLTVVGGPGAVFPEGTWHQQCVPDRSVAVMWFDEAKLYLASLPSEALEEVRDGQ